MQTYRFHASAAAKAGNARPATTKMYEKVEKTDFKTVFPVSLSVA